MQSRGVIDGESIGTIIITFNVYAIFFGDKKTRSVTGFTSFAITYKNGKISYSHEIYAFLSTFAILCYENAAFCFERVPSTNNKASPSSR